MIQVTVQIISRNYFVDAASFYVVWRGLILVQSVILILYPNEHLLNATCNLRANKMLLK